jgi:hypothetical protein
MSCVVQPVRYSGWQKCPWRLPYALHLLTFSVACRTLNARTRSVILPVCLSVHSPHWDTPSFSKSCPEVDLSHSSATEVKNGWNLSSMFHCPFCLWFLDAETTLPLIYTLFAFPIRVFRRKHSEILGEKGNLGEQSVDVKIILKLPYGCMVLGC